MLSLIDVPEGSPLRRLVFQGTPDDARTLLIGIVGTMITVIALALGLTVVALQLSSTQFSPRVLRNFLRDRPNQIVLSVFVATFAYSAAGLYTVGISAGERTEEYPRLAVTGAILLTFASLGMLVFFADRLAHSIQIDSIMSVVERNTTRVIAGGPAGGGGRGDAGGAPVWAVSLPAPRSGYVQSVHPEEVLPLAAAEDVIVLVRSAGGRSHRGGDTVAWVWRGSPGRTRPERGDSARRSRRRYTGRVRADDPAGQRHSGSASSSTSRSRRSRRP